MEEKKLYNAVRKIITLADGRQIEIETGKLAKQADGSVVVKMGDTMLLGTVVARQGCKTRHRFHALPGRIQGEVRRRRTLPRRLRESAKPAPTTAKCSSRA